MALSLKIKIDRDEKASVDIWCKLCGANFGVLVK
jgi:hypothetical protein